MFPPRPSSHPLPPPREARPGVGIAAIGYTIGFLIHFADQVALREPSRQRYFR
jgi:hypothetical protein